MILIYSLIFFLKPDRIFFLYRDFQSANVMIVEGEPVVH